MFGVGSVLKVRRKREELLSHCLDNPTMFHIRLIVPVLLAHFLVSSALGHGALGALLYFAASSTGRDHGAAAIPRSCPALAAEQPDLLRVPGGRCQGCRSRFKLSSVLWRCAWKPQASA